MTKTHRRGTQQHDEHTMLEFGISQDGLRYRYNGYRYDLLDDAVAYARLMRSRPQQKDPVGPFPQSAHVDAPTVDDGVLMASLGIEFDGGIYRFEGYRYDRLADAVTYARLAARRTGANSSVR